MTEERKKFVLYEYLLFFWRKKWAFLAFPIIFALIGVLISQFLIYDKDKPYSGRSTVFVGSITQNEFVGPENIVSQYRKQVENSPVVNVPKNGYIQIQFDGSDKESIQNDLEFVSKDLAETLIAKYNTRFSKTEGDIKTLNEKVGSLENTRNLYLEKLYNEDNVTKIESYTELQLLTENELAESMATIQRMENDLEFFEKPALLSSTVQKADTYLVESIVLGIILGLLAATAFLILWKYLFEARRYYHND